jgi:sulfonate transport system substrate-binding protein
MSQSPFRTPSRRQILQASMLGLGAAAGLTQGTGAAGAAAGRTTDTVRLTWGQGGITVIAKERGAFEKRLAADGIKVEWLGPFPNHAPTLQAVTGGSADFSFGGSTTPALAALIAGAPLVFAQF